MTQPGSTVHPGIVHTGTQPPVQRDWWLAEEVPVALVYNDRPHGVMMASPGDLDDFALGFALGEQILADPAGFVMMRREDKDNGILLCAVIDEDMAGPGFDHQQNNEKRVMEGRSGCGICGAESLDAVTRKLPPVMSLAPATIPDTDILNGAFDALGARQLLNRQNHSVHAAAFCRPDGEVMLVREDVGRHNALDKLIGACFRAGISPDTGYALLTSRCSFELVQKATCAGFPLLASLGAPTGMARHLAAQSGLTLAARAPGNGFMYFAPRTGDTHPGPSRSSE